MWHNPGSSGSLRGAFRTDYSGSETRAAADPLLQPRRTGLSDRGRLGCRSISRADQDPRDEAIVFPSSRTPFSRHHKGTIFSIEVFRVVSMGASQKVPVQNFIFRLRPRQEISRREPPYGNSLPRTQRFVSSAPGKLPFPRPLSHPTLT